jgi:hypothetical protein
VPPRACREHGYFCLFAGSIVNMLTPVTYGYESMPRLLGFVCATATMLSCIHDRGDCPWNGEGSASLRVGNGTGPIAAGASMCASGMIVNAGNRDRELQVCGRDFEFTVAIAQSDFETGDRTITASTPSIGSARVAFTALTPNGNFAYLAQTDATGIVHLSDNSASSGAFVAGTITHVQLALQSCSISDCSAMPATIELNGAFDARVP